MNPEYMSPCGLYCGVCAVLYATRDDNAKFKAALANLYRGKIANSDHLTADDIKCKGCLSDSPFGFCKTCEIKTCCQEKGIEGCHECNDFPCKLIEDFPMPVGKKVILRSVPYRKQHGTAKWVQDEEARYACPGCGHQLFRGAQRCNRCKIEVDLD
jgi:hypothetical protein